MARPGLWFHVGGFMWFIWTPICLRHLFFLPVPFRTSGTAVCFKATCFLTPWNDGDLVGPAVPRPFQRLTLSKASSPCSSSTHRDGFHHQEDPRKSGQLLRWIGLPSSSHPINEDLNACSRTDLSLTAGAPFRSSKVSLPSQSLSNWTSSAEVYRLRWKLRDRANAVDVHVLRVTHLPC